MKGKKILPAGLLLLGLGAYILAGGGNAGNTGNTGNTENIENAEDTGNAGLENTGQQESVDIASSNEDSQTEADCEENSGENKNADSNHTEEQSITDTIYTLESIPEYSGEAYIVLNNNQPEFSEQDKQITDAFEFYSELDELGRCGQAYANICPELQPTEARGEIGQIKPSGWHTVKYNDLIDGNYLYNRCHLIGYQLAGENANEKNLITGTRYLNTIGMLPFEDSVDAYVDATGNHVLYRVTPIYDGNNLVASGVEMEAWSVEDQGAGICFHVYCYNVQPGIEIDYATGDSWEAAAESENSENNALEPAEEDAVRELVINKNTKKFHLPSCSSVQDMAEHNKQEYTGTIGELKEQGYSPCQRCLSEFKD